MAQQHPVLLVILDGFGDAPSSSINAIQAAAMPHLSAWKRQYPHSLLEAAGQAVGLPDGYPGNSEVGHMTIGAGTIITQPLTLINKAIADGSFETNAVLTQALKRSAHADRTVHIIGLMSHAGVHSEMAHLNAYLDAASTAGVSDIVIHAILDGRDTPAKSAEVYLSELETLLTNYTQARLGTIQGRFYAMDRDGNWDRTCATFACLTEKTPIDKRSWRTCIADSYNQQITDEFIPPTRLSEHSAIADGDGIICIQFRPERMGQLIRCLSGNSPCHIPQVKPDYIITPVSYGPELATTVLFPSTYHEGGLKQRVSEAGKKIFAIAETEKYAHVTYFFSGGRREPFAGETQVLIPSIKARTYADYPCMSAPQITDRVLRSLHDDPADLYIINYANADMVGHSGNISATIKAVECLDTQLGRLYDQVVPRGGTLIITADHGKAEDMTTPAHTSNKVPFISISNNATNYRDMMPKKGLSEIASLVAALLSV